MNTSSTTTLARLTKAALPAAPVALGALSSAHAQIVHTTVDVTMAASDHKFIFVDMGTGGSPGAAALASPHWQAPFTIPVSSPTFYLFFRDWSNDLPEWGSNSNATFDGDNLAATTGQGNTIANLLLGTTIDSSLNLGGNYSAFAGRHTVDAEWSPGTTGYMGLKFDTNATPLYGWAQISYNADKTLTLVDFAYEASGGAIAAGDTGASAVPEPSTYAALAGLLAGTAACFAKRRRRQPAETAAA